MINRKVPEVLLKARKLACENSKFEIFFDHIEQADGLMVKDYLVVSPRVRTAELMTGVSVLPVVDGKVALIQMYRHPLGEHVWEVPRGFIDEGEGASVSAMRELAEETGLACRDEDMISLGWMAPEAGVLAAKIQLFVALNCTQEKPSQADELGHGEMRLFKMREVAAMIASSEIVDPSTIISFFKYQALHG